MNRTELAIKLFNPNDQGISRWVWKDECVGEFSDLMPTNGNMWYRNKGIGGTYVFEKENMNGKDRWRLNGFIDNKNSRPISNEIRKTLLSDNPVCSHMGFSDTVNDKLVIDHKNGRYNDERVLSVETQTIDDFQVLSNRVNLFKRSCCQNCEKTGVRFDAKTLGFTKSVCEGSLKYEGSCIGCYWYDPMKFKGSQSLS
jgi:hypothetical protein